MAPEKLLSEFLKFCDRFLDIKDMKILIMKRFEACEDTFKNSDELKDLIAITQAKIETDKSRPFVYLRDFLNELKAYHVKGGKTAGKHLKRRRKAESSLSDTESLPRKHFKGDNVNVHYESDSCIDGKAAGTCKQNTNMGDISSMSSSNYLPGQSTKNCQDHPSKDHSSSPLQNGIKDVQDVKVDERKLLMEDKYCSSKNSTSPSSPHSITSSLIKDNKGSKMSSPTITVIDLDDIKVDNNRFCEDRHVHTETSETVRTFSNNFEDFVKNQPEASSSGETPAPVQDSTTSSLDEEERKKKNSVRQVERLENLLEKIRNKIERIRAKELSLDDLDDEASSYIFEDKLQQKFVKVWDKLCQLKGRDSSTGRPSERRFRYQGSRYNEVNKRIERFVNKRKTFPDFGDIRNLIQKVNTHRHLSLGSTAVDNLARECFLDVGNKLQERRQEDFICTFGSSLTDNFSHHADPAIYDLELKRKLDENKKISRSKLEEVLVKYSMKQDEMGEKPEEVPDDVDPEDESDGEEENERKAANTRLTLERDGDTSDTSVEEIAEVISYSQGESQDEFYPDNSEKRLGLVKNSPDAISITSTVILEDSEQMTSPLREQQQVVDESCTELTNLPLSGHSGQFDSDSVFENESLDDGIPQCQLLITNVVSINQECEQLSDSKVPVTDSSFSVVEILDSDSDSQEQLEHDDTEKNISLEQPDVTLNDVKTEISASTVKAETSSSNCMQPQEESGASDTTGTSTSEQLAENTPEDTSSKGVSYRSLNLEQRSNVLNVLSALNKLKVPESLKKRTTQSESICSATNAKNMDVIEISDVSQVNAEHTTSESEHGTSDHREGGPEKASDPSDDDCLIILSDDDD